VLPLTFARTAAEALSVASLAEPTTPFTASVTAPPAAEALDLALST